MEDDAPPSWAQPTAGSALYEAIASHADEAGAQTGRSYAEPIHTGSPPPTPASNDLKRLKPGQAVWVPALGRPARVLSNNPFFRVAHLDAGGGSVLEASYEELEEAPAAGGADLGTSDELAAAISELQSQVQGLKTELRGLDSPPAHSPHGSVARGLGSGPSHQPHPPSPNLFQRGDDWLFDGVSVADAHFASSSFAHRDPQYSPSLRSRQSPSPSL